MTARVDELVAARVPFVHATVVRAQHPTSARPGDDAVILADGTMEGFVGGQCAEESVRLAAVDALRAGEPLLLRVLPGDGEDFPEVPGSRVVVNPCLSGGALEIFLEPVVHTSRVHVVGATPIADAMVALAEHLGFTTSRGTDVGGPDGADGLDGVLAVVVSSLGHDEEKAIRAAIDANVGYVGLVASSKRGEALLAAMELTPDERRRVHVPVGLAIGAVTAEEIALSALAEIVRAVRVDGLSAAVTRSGPAGAGSTAVAGATDGASAPTLAEPDRAVDPVCAMTVVVSAATPHLAIDGEDYWFCSTSCRDSFAAPSAR